MFYLAATFGTSDHRQRGLILDGTRRVRTLEFAEDDIVARANGLICQANKLDQWSVAYRGVDRSVSHMADDR